MKNTQSNIDDLSQFRGDTPWGKINMKLKHLLEEIEMVKGPSMDIDDAQWRWVDDRINALERDGRKLTRAELRIANKLWKTYGEKV